MVVIGIDGSGNPVAFLPDNPKIFLNDHNFGETFDLASNFSEYVERALDGRIEASF